MSKLYIITTLIGAGAFAVYYNWQLAPNPWIVEDLTSGRSDICKVHQSKMEKRKVNMVYGYGAPWSWIKENAPDQKSREAFILAEEQGFPNARDKAYDGCLISNKSPASAYIYICGDCVVALKKYHQHKTANQPFGPTAFGRGSPEKSGEQR